jgi:hypothetical protein
MIKKFEHFIKEGYNPDLLAEIEQRFVTLDDLDIEYTIEDYVFTSDEFNTYKIGYKIKTNVNVDDYYIEISSVIRYFEKYYKFDIISEYIVIYEKITLSKNELLKLLVNDIDTIKQIEKITLQILEKLRIDIKENKFYYNNQLWIQIYEIHKTTWVYSGWYNLFNNLNINHLDVITKALLEDYFNCNVYIIF